MKLINGTVTGTFKCIKSDDVRFEVGKLYMFKNGCCRFQNGYYQFSHPTIEIYNATSKKLQFIEIKGENKMKINLCEFFGVEENEVFEFESRSSNYLIRNNQLFSDSRDCKFMQSTLDFNYVITLNVIKKPFQPKNGEQYYYPSVECYTGVICVTWTNHHLDRTIQKRVGVYRTKEEALKKAKELGWIE